MLLCFRAAAGEAIIRKPPTKVAGLLYGNRRSQLQETLTKPSYPQCRRWYVCSRIVGSDRIELHADSGEVVDLGEWPNLFGVLCCQLLSNTRNSVSRIGDEEMYAGVTAHRGFRAAFLCLFLSVSLLVSFDLR